MKRLNNKLSYALYILLVCVFTSCCKGMGFIDLPNGENCYCACEKGKEQRSQQYEL